MKKFRAGANALILFALCLVAASSSAREVGPQRIVSLLPSLTEMVFAVGAGDRVVGVTTFCTYPEDAGSRMKVGGYVPSSMSLERIVGLRPDLVLSSGDLQMPAVQQLRQLGLRVEIVAAPDVAGTLEGIRRVGALVGRSSEAEAVVAGLQAELEDLKQRFGEIPREKRPRVFYEVWHDPLMTAGGGSFISELIELAGGNSLFHDVEREYFQVSFEEVVARRPEVILGAEIQGGMGDLDTLTEQPGWRDLPAVKEGRIFAIDGDIVSRPGPRLGQALRLMAERLHPVTVPDPEP